ncbi:MAG TPA: hypothetical protein VIC60_10465 [Thermomicrobiales bacterium]
MYGYEATVLFMVGKAIDAEKLATAKRERILNEQSRTRRARRSK